MKEVAAHFGCSLSYIYKHWTLGVLKKPKIRIELEGKDEPYYYNEDNYGKIPTYKRSELSAEEQLIFKKLK